MQLNFQIPPRQFSHQKQWSWRNFEESFAPSCYYSSENLNSFEVIIEVKQSTSFPNTL
ncbi:hypothetical protein L873DRAFT_19522 [Choiromyces venosus 120613-1]|uniref:Uncharacterized protein n=1 Tax=Choiromyces venosus 120613-1 TaxID=1336337 RepID=A0A3N4K6A3_9PEZI|nr:hypothetical protein L873DRAFT_19522 [Choiromyces venosus 120613-1]